MKRELREKVYMKYSGRCAYCGEPITYKQMQVDHLVPIFRGWSYEQIEKCGIERGTDDFSNLMPSCAKCNNHKSTFSIEQFRAEIKVQIKRLQRDSSAYRRALKYGLIEETNKEVVFYFETQ